MAEEQQKMAMGLQSKRGALRELGEQFPEEKMQEVFEEMQEDIYDQGALDMVVAQVQSLIVRTTGMMPGGEPAASSGGQVTSASDSAGSDGESLLPALPTPSPEVVSEISQRAFGARLPQRRVPESD